MLTEIGLFAGIGGFQLGFQQAGIETVAMVEIDTAAQGVLARRFPGVPILSDVRDAGAHNLPPCDILSFGFPCQDLSVAGKRSGLAGARSGLFYEATRIADELRPALLTWENVPGLLSSNSGRDFAAVLLELDRIGYSGCWTTLDAQFFGVAQRRQRIFGVFARRDIGTAVCAEILSLAARLPWNTEKGGTPRAGVASALTRSAGRHGRSGPRGDGSDNLIAGTLNGAKAESRSTSPDGNGAWIAFAHQSGGDCRLSITEDATPALQASQVYAVFGGNNTSGERARDSALTSHGSGRYDFESENFVVASALSASHGGADDNDAQANHLVAVSIAENQRGELRTSDVAAQLTNGGGKPGQGYAAVMTFQERGREDGRNLEYQDNIAYALTNPGAGGRAQERNIAGAFGVRRLTPLECERLQGFPDGWTAESVNGSQADSARYRQLGNAVAVPCARWLGQRIMESLR